MKRNIRMMKVLLFIFMWTTAIDSFGQKLSQVENAYCYSYYKSNGIYVDVNGDGALERLAQNYDIVNYPANALLKGKYADRAYYEEFFTEDKDEGGILRKDGKYYVHLSCYGSSFPTIHRQPTFTSQDVNDVNIKLSHNWDNTSSSVTSQTGITSSLEPQTGANFQSSGNIKSVNDIKEFFFTSPNTISAKSEDNTISFKFSISHKDGMSFIPQSISFKVSKTNSQEAVFDVAIISKGKETMLATGVVANRNNSTEEWYTNCEYDIKNIDVNNEIIIKLYVTSYYRNSGFGVGDLQLEGVATVMKSHAYYDVNSNDELKCLTAIYKSRDFDDCSIVTGTEIDSYFGGIDDKTLWAYGPQNYYRYDAEYAIYAYRNGGDYYIGYYVRSGYESYYPFPAFETVELNVQPSDRIVTWFHVKNQEELDILLNYLLINDRTYIDGNVWKLPVKTASVTTTGVTCWIDRSGVPVKRLPTIEEEVLLVEDMNGDGIEDIITSGKDGYPKTGEYCYLSTTDTYEKVLMGSNDMDTNSCIVDINHDGLKDIFFYCTKNYVTKPVAYIQTADHRFIFEELQIVTDSKELENANFSDGGDGSFTQGGSKGFSFADGMWAYAREFLFDFDDDASASRRVAPLGSEDYADLMVVDINNDGYSDIITNSHQSLLSLPDGRYYAGTLAGKVAIADINEDGLMDIVLFNTSTNAVMLYLSNDGGGFSEKKLIDNGSVTAMYCQDFNGDGLTDIMLQAASEIYSFIVFFMNNGNGQFTKKENMLTGDYAFSKPYDFSNNGKASVLAACYSNHYQNKRIGFDAQLKFLTWDSNLTLSEEYITYNESQLYSTGDWNYHTQSWVIPPFKVADFDGDGIMDILCRDNTGSYSNSNYYICSPFSPTANTAPQQMVKPNVIYDKKNGRVKVEWQMGEDKETSSGDLRYTVRMGSTEESQNRMVYDAGVSRYCIANTGTWPRGDVFVSVRAIDANGKTGKWSPVARFTVDTQSAEFTMNNKNNDYIYFTTADTLVVHSLNGKQLTWTLPADGKIIKQDADSAYIMFTNYGEKIIEASMENGNRVSHTVTVLPVRHEDLIGEGFYGIFDLNANGLTEILRNDGIYTFDKTYSKMGTMFNSDITSVEELTFIDKTMNGLPDVYGKEIVKNGVTNHWLINRGDLDFEVEATDIGNAPTLFVDINNDGLMDYMDGAVMINKGDFTFDKGNAGSRLFADLDRDGFIELVCFVNNTDASTMKTYPIILRIYKYDVISNQLKLVCEHKKTPDYDYGLNQTRCILDYNHDGYPDIVWSVRDNNYSYKGYALLGSKEMDYSEKVELPGSPMIVDLDNNGFTDYFTYSNVFRPYKGTVLMGEPEGIIKLDYPADCGFTNDFCITSIPVFCDYNNDGIPDSGKDYHYHGNINKSSFDNSSPTAPTYVSVSQEDNYVVVSWSGATDKETPNMSLRYNLSVKEKGKTGDGSYIISPLNLTKDEAKTVDAGTLQYRYATRFPIPFSRFAVGKTYEIQVQTIDGWHAHSPFSQVVEFTPTAQVLFTMPEKARVNQEVKFTLKSNSGVSPVIDADGGVVKVNGKTITWSTPGVKTVSITKGTITSKRQIQIFDTPNLTFNVPSKVLTGSVLKVALPADFRRADATVELTGSNGLTCAINNDVAIVTVPKRSGNYELKISYEDDVFGKLEETRHVEGINFIPEISKVGITDDGCRIEWKNDMGSQISDMITGKVKIYRETSITGRYEEIGTANISDGFIIDRTARSDIKSYRYMITLPTTYGSESMPSNEHSTVLLLANQGLGNDINLHWNSYEGSQVATYTIYAGSSRDNLQAIDEVSGNTLSYVHHRNSNSLTYYAIGYTLTSELADAVPMHHAASAGSVCSNVICSDEAYNVLMVQNISVYEKDGYNELNKERTQLNMQATVTPALATLARVEWSITTGNDLAEVDQSGILTIKSNTTGGTVTVQARSIDGSNITGSMDISVTPYSITGMQTLMSESEVSLRYADHGIYVDNIRQATDVSILSISGSVVYRNRIATDYYIPLAGGIYIVKAGKTVQKVAIK